jgi:proteasome alpha subunit
MDMPTEIQHQQMGYDRTSTMFSPDGHLLQVEYAEKTVRLGSSSVGMVCSDGIFIVSDKRIRDKLVVPESANKIYEIDSHILASVAGIMSDARVLIDRVQVLAQQNMLTYDSPIEPELVIKEIANVQQQFTQYGGGRPFGVSIMVAGINENKSELFVSDITGNYFSYFANAIGEDDETIREKLREDYKRDLDLKKGIKLALKILEEVKGDKFKIENMELSYIKKNDDKIVRLNGKEIKDIN